MAFIDSPPGAAPEGIHRRIKWASGGELIHRAEEAEKDDSGASEEEGIQLVCNVRELLSSGRNRIVSHVGLDGAVINS